MCREVVGAEHVGGGAKFEEDGIQVDDDEEPTAFEQIGMNAEGVEDDIERVQAHVFRRRIRVKPFFARFDPLHTGRCSRNEFSRALASVVLPNFLNDAETPIDDEALAESFADPDHEPRAVNYIKFCDVVDQVFNIHHLEKTPDTYVASPGATVLDAGGFLARHVHDEAGIEQVLMKIALLTETRGIDLHTCFNTRSRAPVDVRVGRMEARDFVASFPLAQSTPTKTAALTKADMRLLVERYSDDNGFVRLVPFEKDVKALVVQTRGAGLIEPSPPHMPGSNGTSTKGLSLRSSPWFPLQPPPEKMRPQSARSGTSSRTNALSRGAFDPTQSRVRPQSASPFQAQRPQSARTDTSEQASFRIGFDPQRPPSAMTGRMSPESNEETTPGKNAERVQASWMPPSASLRHRGDDTETSRNASAPRRPQSARTYHPTTYASQESTEQTSSGNAFCSQRPPRPQSASTAGRPNSARQVPPPPTVMAKLTKTCYERRLRLRDIFRDADPLKSGMITRTKMYTALAVLGISFSPKEYHTLFETFENANGLFCYLDCAAVVEASISKTKGVGGNGAVAARSIMQGGGIQTDAVIDEDEKVELERIETVLANRSLSRRLDIFPILDDLSHSRWAQSGHVTEGQFLRAIKDMNFDLDLTEKDINTLLEKYCDTEMANEFNYMDFCKSIEKHMAKMTFIQSRFDLSGSQDTPQLQVASGPTWPNPYFDKVGRVRPSGSRPNSARARPQYGNGNGVVPAGWRPGAFSGGHVGNHWW